MANVFDGVLRRSFWLSLLTTLMVAAPAQGDEPNAVRTMAGIVAGLQHFPDDAAKETLGIIAQDDAATAAEKTIATAIAGIEHAVSAVDKEKLEMIAADSEEPDTVRELAAILAAFNHVPSDAAKARLEALAAADD